MNMLADAATWLEGQRHAYMTSPVVYSRGAASVEPAATIGKTVFRSTDDYGQVVYAESRDFLIRAQDLVLDGVAVEPESGDRITEGGRVYEVLAPNNEPVWRWSDQNRITRRIHTKDVGEA